MVEVLLGFTKNKEVVFGDVRYKNGVFTASFDLSEPCEITRELLIDNAESMIECSDKEWVLDKLEYYDCKPSELAEKMIEDTYDAVESFFDISLYSESFSIPEYDNDIYFLASSCGQADTRDNMSIYINKELYDAIHELWDEYHLKNVDYSVVQEVFEAIEHQNNTMNEYKVVEQYLIRHF